MNIQTYYPPDILKPFIREYKIIQSSGDAVNYVLPDTVIVLVFRFDTGHAINDKPCGSLIAGISPVARQINYAAGLKTLLVLFSEGGAAAFLKLPLNELLGKRAPLHDLLPTRIISVIEDRLNEAKTDRERLAVVESFLLDILSVKSLNPAIEFAIREIKRRQGSANIAELATSAGVSIDGFGKRFRQLVGTTPKQFAAIVKLRHTIRRYSAANSLTDLAYDMNYFDQSHFIKNFKHFTGKTPKEFFRRGGIGESW